MINYAIVEDDPEIRGNVEDMVNADENYRCIISVDRVEYLLNRLDKDNLPRVIIMDINLPGMSGIDGTRLIKKKYETIEVIMLTSYDDSNRVFDSLKAGASGYLLKTTSFKELHESMQLLQSGGAPMTPQIARKTLEFFRPQKKEPSKSPLTEKEKEVVQGLVDGLSYKLIAERMFISVGTIYTHIKNIYKKLRVNSKAEVITKSLRGEI